MTSFEQLKDRTVPIAVVGLGYVGLPLAVALAEHFDVIGFDVSRKRIAELSQGMDRTREVDNDRLKQATVSFTSDPTSLSAAGVVIVAVPTPIDKNRRPDLGPVIGASTTVGQHMKYGTVIVYESTVYPGVTEEICRPILEKESGLTCGTDFWLGYSPERINPGDRAHTLETIVKVVSGQTPEVADLLNSMYSTVVKAGTYKAESIKVAEAAKVIENIQRDVNIALMNELSQIFSRMQIDTGQVLAAAGTKWNFLPFRPGLVGGHCIGVDPYYMTFKAEELGFHPQMILSGRRINDGMGKYVAETMVKKMIQQGCAIKGTRIGVLGVTFKENCPDLRNTRVVDIIAELNDYGCEVLPHDPFADPEEALQEYGIQLMDLEEINDIHGLIIAVSHSQYADTPLQTYIDRFSDPEKPVIADLKGILDLTDHPDLKNHVWRL